MKPSDAMLKGFGMAGGEQCTCAYFRGDHRKPDSVCAVASIWLGADGDANQIHAPKHPLVALAESVFEEIIGHPVRMEDINNGSVTGQHGPMSIPDIAGILAAEGY